MESWRLQGQVRIHLADSQESQRTIFADCKWPKVREVAKTHPVPRMVGYVGGEMEKDMP